ncbi:MAG TPA: glutamate-5-semialdehyde dehydrogenase [Caulobacteraceae bacterium]
MPIPYGGDRVTHVPEALAAAFQPGDRLIVVQDTGELLHVPQRVHDEAAEAVGQAADAFEALQRAGDAQITAFFDAFARRLASEAAWTAIEAANEADVARARDLGRSTTRLAVSPKMRADMIAGLQAWRDAPAPDGRVIERIEHPGWSVEQVVAPLGVVGFVFEGRPNVFADAAGVIRGRNAAVFRIGSDALGTARAIAEHALKPALRDARLPMSAAVLLDNPDRAAGWAMFSDRRLALAVARGSGPAVAQLGAVARQAGVPASLHGTGGAWMIALDGADAARLRAAVAASLDRKVCNTLNVCCLVGDGARRLMPAFLDGLKEAGERHGAGCKLHVVSGHEWLPTEWLAATTTVRRADGDHVEPLVERLDEAGLATEWEWEETPEVTLVCVSELEDAVALFNRHSPQFIVSLISEAPEAHRTVWASANANFVGDGMTRWVDGQYALDRPELGLSNWQNGRLLARGGVLSGDSVYTVRMRMYQDDPKLHR